jgi:uncharacterized protein with HEPN domain
MRLFAILRSSGKNQRTLGILLPSHLLGFDAVKNLSDELKTQFPVTGWKAVAGFRDTLIHGYFGVDMEILWDIIAHKIPVLQKEIVVIIAHEKAKKK